MKNSSDAVGSRTLMLVAQCLNQLHHRVSQMGVVACLNPEIESLVLTEGLDGPQKGSGRFREEKKISRVPAMGLAFRFYSSWYGSHRLHFPT